MSQTKHLTGLVPHSSLPSRSLSASSLKLSPRDDSESTPAVTMSAPSDVPMPPHLTAVSNDDEDDEKTSLEQRYGLYFTAFLLVVIAIGVLECCLRSMKAKAEMQKVKREAEKQREMQAEEHGLVEQRRSQGAGGPSGENVSSGQRPVGVKEYQGADQNYGHEFVDVKL